MNPLLKAALIATTIISYIEAGGGPSVLTLIDAHDSDFIPFLSPIPSALSNDDTHSTDSERYNWQPIEKKNILIAKTTVKKIKSQRNTQLLVGENNADKDWDYSPSARTRYLIYGHHDPSAPLHWTQNLPQR